MCSCIFNLEFKIIKIYGRNWICNLTEIEFVNNFLLVYCLYELCRCGFCEKWVCVCVCWVLVRCECWVVGAVRWECEWCIKVSEVRVLCELVGCMVRVLWESVWLWEKRSVWWVGHVNEKKRVVQWGPGREKRNSVEVNSVCFMSEVRECYVTEKMCRVWVPCVWEKRKWVRCGFYNDFFLIINMPRLNYNWGSNDLNMPWVNNQGIK